MSSSTAAYLNPEARTWTFQPDKAGPHSSASDLFAFHKQLPGYNETRLHSLPELARELRLGHVLLKDESDRFGLPSFKILGISWAAYRAVARRIGRQDPPKMRPSVAELGAMARDVGLRLVTCTEGNCGRAVARMGTYMGIPVTVFVPSFMPEHTRETIRREGAEVTVVDGNYDDSVAAAREAGDGAGAVLVLDVGLDGYEDVPQWVVQGYGTMLDESDRQALAITGGEPVTHAVVPVGAGSIAQAVTQHFKSGADRHPRARVIGVEPIAAASLKTSLEAGQSTTVPTADTIMCGMNCGTLSTTAWPVLRAGVDASVVVSDLESHAEVEWLARSSAGIRAGPCGAATVAALRRACGEIRDVLMLDEGSVVILYCTEGSREYDVAKVELGSGQ